MNPSDDSAADPAVDLLGALVPSELDELPAPLTERIVRSQQALDQWADNPAREGLIEEARTHGFDLSALA